MVATPLNSKRASKSDDASFRDGAWDNEGTADGCVGRDDADDATGDVVGDPTLAGSLCAVEGAVEVGADDGVETAG